MSGLPIMDDPVTLVLLGALVLLIVPPVVFVTLWRVTRLPFRAGGTFRWVYLAWASLLAAGSVWKLSTNPRFSLSEAGASNFVQLAFLALAALAILFIGAKYRFEFISELMKGVLGIFSVFAVWCVVSSLWSTSTAGTLFKSFEYGTMLVLFALATSLTMLVVRDPQNQLRALKSIFDWNWFLIFLLLLSVYVGVFVLPGYAIKPQTGGLGFSVKGAIPQIASNGVGQLGAILGTVALVRFLSRPKSYFIHVPVFAFSLIAMVLAQSRTPIVAFLVAVVVVLVASRRFGLLALFGSLSGAMLLSVYSQGIYEFLRRGQEEGSLTTLSGRTVYWEKSLEAMQGHWLTGYGASAGGKYVLKTFLSEDVSTIHSTYVEVLLGTGVVGLALLLLGVGAAWFWLFKLRSYAAKDAISRMLWLECLGIFTLLSVRSVFSVSAFVWSETTLTFGLILIFITVMRRQVVQRHHTGAALAQQVPATRRRRPSIRS